VCATHLSWASYGVSFLCARGQAFHAKDRRFTLGSNDPGPALICLSRACRWLPEDSHFMLGLDDPGPDDLPFARSLLAGRPRLPGPTQDDMGIGTAEGE
jgi:hypothetical protein